MKHIQLVPIDRTGNVNLPMDSLPEFMKENCRLTATFYQSVGFDPPWISYISIADGIPVGGAGFKGAPRDNCVEIAYYTEPEHECQGFATATAQELIKLARHNSPTIIITAQTLPVLDASNALLKKLGFEFQGALNHPEDGEIWEWRLDFR